MRPCCELNHGTDLAIKISAHFFLPFCFVKGRSWSNSMSCPQTLRLVLLSEQQPLQRNGAAANAFAQHCWWVLCIKKPWPELSGSGMLPHAWPKGQGWPSQKNFFPPEFSNPERVEKKGSKIGNVKGGASSPKIENLKTRGFFKNCLLNAY